MDWININVNLIRGEEYIDAEPVSRATWLSLTAWCGSQENGGIIADSRKWGDRKWQQLCGVTLSEVETTCLLYGFVGDNLVVNFYPVEQEAKVILNRANGKKGGRPPANPPPQPVEPQEEKPCGLPSGSDSLKRNSNSNSNSKSNSKRKSNSNSPTSDDVEKVWRHYPNKQGKKKALPAIKKALEKYSVEDLLERVALYTKTKDPKYYAHGDTYFCNERYEDDLTPPKATKFGNL